MDGIFPKDFNSAWLEEQLTVPCDKEVAESMTKLRAEIYSKMCKAIAHIRNGGSQTYITFTVVLPSHYKNVFLDDLVERFPNRIWYYDLFVPGSLGLLKVGNCPADVKDFQIKL